MKTIKAIDERYLNIQIRGGYIHDGRKWLIARDEDGDFHVMQLAPGVKDTFNRVGGLMPLSMPIPKKISELVNSNN